MITTEPQCSFGTGKMTAEHLQQQISGMFCKRKLTWYLQLPFYDKLMENLLLKMSMPVSEDVLRK